MFYSRGGCIFDHMKHAL